ncbi:MAG: 50S ribosomal protein L22 [Armatimonadetes bacterium]|nr:50S ribosomal protein L22 [Armatimonadota bacterium]
MAEQIVAEAKPKFHRESRKQGRGRKVPSNQAHAVAKFLRVPPRKARLVMDEVRGQYVQEALAFLSYIPNRAAGYISKVVTSAASNGVNNHSLRLENLKIVEARADEGPRMKRVQPRAQGRAYAILKRTSHITIIVEDVPRPPTVRKVGTRAAAARAARATQLTTATND